MNSRIDASSDDNRGSLSGAAGAADALVSQTHAPQALEAHASQTHGLAALRKTQQQLEFALHAGGLGCWELDFASRRFTTSAHSRANYGLGPDHPFESIEDVDALVHPDDRPRRKEVVERAVATGEDFEVEYRTLRPDGGIGWVLARGRAVFEDGRAVRLVGVSLDITARKAAEERQRLLLDELNHRVKNTLASVQSIAMQTLRHVEHLSGFNETFIDRIHALSRAHELLAEAAWEGASLSDVIGRTLDSHLRQDHRRQVALSGPSVRLAPNAAVTLNMAFHELAANAIRFGAFSTPGGRVDVEWASATGGDAVVIDWRESGGPEVAAPDRRGFGSQLIEQGLAREMGGEARLNFLPRGLWCQMRLPLSAKLSFAA